MKYFIVETNVKFKVAIAADSEKAAYYKTCYLCDSFKEIPKELCTFTETDAVTASEVGLIGEDE